jgi:hypothetical protein
MGKRTGLFIFLLWFGMVYHAIAQGFNPYGNNNVKDANSSPIRTFVSNFALGFSSGYNYTFYKHDLSGYSIMNHNDNLYLLDNNRTPANFLNSGYRDWVHYPRELNLLQPRPENILVNSDTSKLGFKTLGKGIPLNITLHYNAGRFRAGLGTSFEFHRIGTFRPISHSDIIPEFSLEENTTVKTRFFGLFGVKVWEIGDWVYLVDTQFGSYDLGRAISPETIEKSMFFNIGGVIEKNVSEYFRFFGRVSYEFKNYQAGMEETGVKFHHKIPALWLNVGINMSYPDKPRCKISNCHVQMEHRHGGAKEWRGQPFYKKQNPHYGELHPKLLKHKGKNNRIRNAF